MDFNEQRDDVAYRREVVNLYKPQVEKLVHYLPWLETKYGESVAQTYSGQGLSANSLAFHVYDGTLMSFVKDAKQTGLLDRNYVYAYSRNRMRSVEDEKRVIKASGIKEMENLTAILAKYVLEGQTKGSLWNQAVTEGIFLEVVKKMKENIEFWDKPMNVQ